MKMNKTFFIAIVCGCMWWNTASAQVDRSEMMNRRAEQLADNLGLKDESKTAFVETYKTYQQELISARMAGIDPSSMRNNEKTEDLTDEEATKRIQAQFDREAQQIVNAYNALEVEKKYYAEFAKTLTPKQLMQIFVNQPRMGRNNRPAMGGQNRGNRSFRGGQRGGFPGGNFGDDAFGDE